jgi:hypothetical protein
MKRIPNALMALFFAARSDDDWAAVPTVSRL